MRVSCNIHVGTSLISAFLSSSLSVFEASFGLDEKNK